MTTRCGLGARGARALGLTAPAACALLSATAAATECECVGARAAPGTPRLAVFAGAAYAESECVQLRNCSACNSVRGCGWCEAGLFGRGRLQRSVSLLPAPQQAGASTAAAEGACMDGLAGAAYYPGVCAAPRWAHAACPCSDYGGAPVSCGACLSRAPRTAQAGFVLLQDGAGPPSPFRVPVCASRALNAAGPYWVTLSLQ